MTITFTLTSGSSSTAAGPFNISGTTSGGGLNIILIATGITKQQLVTGHTVTNVTPENITGGTITSTGTCNTTTTWRIYPAGYYYTIQQLEPHCSGNIGTCGGPINSTKIAYSTVSIDITKYYNSSGDIYEIINTTTPKASDMDISSWVNSGYVNCGDAINC